MTTHQTTPEPTPTARKVIGFALDTRPADLPQEVLETTALYLLDCIGVLAAAARLDAGRIARDHAVAHWAAGPGAPNAQIAFDGRDASLPGAAFAMATQLDNLDAHDGWQASKGHAGAALVPALIALGQDGKTRSGREFLTTLALGYEISNYASSALHNTVPDYHTSGAWNALGTAAMAARMRNLTPTQTRHALGIAEYHAPRSQMMREIANPSMLHDGSGFGAPVGLYAALIAQDGFLGAPAATVEFDDAAPDWVELGQIWRVMDQYIKPYPICRWAHAPIDAALEIHRAGITPEQITSVRIETFNFAAALSNAVPSSPHEAQYTMAWAVACALVRGRVGVAEILDEAFTDAELIAMTGKITSHATPHFEAQYPVARTARVVFDLTDGRSIDSGEVIASGGPDPQPTRAEVVAKFRAFAGSVLPENRAEAILRVVFDLTSGESNSLDLLNLLGAPPG